MDDDAEHSICRWHQKLVSRDSVKKALANGITADQVRRAVMLQAAVPLIRKIELQIISYLTTHAHPQMRKNVCSFYSAPPKGPAYLYISETETASSCDGAGSDSPLGAGEE